MAAQKERRRRRRCPSCGGEMIVRGGLVEGVLVMLVPQTELSERVISPVYSDTCGDCGLVMLYARVAGT